MEFKHKKSISQKGDLIIPFYKDDIDQDRITRLTGVSKVDFEAEFSTYTMIYSKSGSKIYLLGLGESKHKNRINESFRHLFFNEKSKLGDEIQVDCICLSLQEVNDAVIGMTMSQYEIAQYKTEKKSKSTLDVLLVSGEDISYAMGEGFVTGDTINRIKVLVDAPPNVKTPAFLAQWARESSKKNGYQCKVWNEKDLIKDGFAAITAVGQGSQHPPRLIQCSYLPKDGKKVDIALVGKGITFDTGGLSIKGSTNLHYMKSDMGGAAAVLGAVELASRLKLNVNIVGIVGAAENAVDGNSYLPGDVIQSYSGKSIEIIDTDAEGRLVLADGLNYAIKKHKPKTVIDLATLTGSAVRTLGYSAAAMFTSNDKMAAKLYSLGDEIFERVWRLPIYEELSDDIHSDIADVRNFSGKPVAGASAAAKFLEYFTEGHPSWVHLDIAGVAFGANAYAKMKSSSGYGVRLMVEYIKTLE
ncbi:leucyl aminopeptidase family protein [Portibacter lacus]|uniref:Cytosol aminopeptidase n=1 Tax=Portibacter lacus TaxID=1099794 RepID=A0AA37SNK9_9BACT|nr:leucyl aminopeptidase family protein [Portibacter lacus]GLR17147.1 putative cytosol aminopeptidase [Portibacter lacus]